MLRFSCPKCQAHLRADEGKQGTKVICPKCKTRLQVPAVEAPEEIEEIEEIEELEEPPAEKRLARRKPREEEEEEEPRAERPRRQPREEEEEEEEESRPERPQRKRRRPRPVSSSGSGGVGLGILGSILGWVLGVVVLNIIGCCGFFGWMWFIGSREDARWEAEEAERRANALVINAAQLIQEFQQQPGAADTKYEDKYLVVTGIVDRVDIDRRDDWVYLFIHGGDDKVPLRLQCYFDFEDADTPAVKSLQKEQPVTIRCIYMGFVGNNIELGDCTLEK